MRVHEKPPLPPAGGGGVLLSGYRVVLALVLALAFLLIAGTIFAFLRGRDEKPLFMLGAGDALSGRADAGGTGDSDGDLHGPPGIFTGIGRLRIPVAGPGTVILSIAFPYSPGDRPFAEELAARVPDFRRAALEYFGSLDGAALENIDGEAARAEILRRYNALLRLGKLETLYFYDLMMIE